MGRSCSVVQRVGDGICAAVVKCQRCTLGNGASGNDVDAGARIDCILNIGGADVGCRSLTLRAAERSARGRGGGDGDVRGVEQPVARLHDHAAGGQHIGGGLDVFGAQRRARHIRALRQCAHTVAFAAYNDGALSGAQGAVDHRDFLAGDGDISGVSVHAVGYQLGLAHVDATRINVDELGRQLAGGQHVHSARCGYSGGLGVLAYRHVLGGDEHLFHRRDSTIAAHGEEVAPGGKPEVAIGRDGAVDHRVATHAVEGDVVGVGQVEADALARAHIELAPVDGGVARRLLDAHGVATGGDGGAAVDHLAPCGQGPGLHPQQTGDQKRRQLSELETVGQWQAGRGDAIGAGAAAACALSQLEGDRGDALAVLEVADGFEDLVHKSSGDNVRRFLKSRPRLLLGSMCVCLAQAAVAGSATASVSLAGVGAGCWACWASCCAITWAPICEACSKWRITMARISSIWLSA